MGKYVIWSLNRATALIASREHKVINALKAHGHEVVFGDRSPKKYNHIELNHRQSFIEHAYDLGAGRASDRRRRRNRGSSLPTKDARNAQLKVSAKHRLMHEGKKSDEYYVPIPLKVLGDAQSIYENEHLSSQQQARLKKIINHKGNTYFKNKKLLNAYWQKGVTEFPELNGHFSNVRMNTSPETKTGLYQIIREFHSKPKYKGWKSILIGYSQGGLVANYLAAVDQHIFGKNHIDAVISIGSPNLGSPLANPSNSFQITNGFFQLISSILGIDISHENFHTVFNQQKGYSIEHLSDILEALIVDYGGGNNAEGLVTLRKWMTGALNSDFTAFRNLRIQDINNPGTPIGFIKKHPISIPHTGAIINANPSFDGIIQDIFPLSGLLDFLIGGINLEHGTKVFSRYIMNENIKNPSSAVQKIIKERQEETLDEHDNLGIEGGKIHRLAHDFVIPSNRMLVPTSKNFLGNHVNETSNHLTGGSYAYSEGRDNFDTLLKLVDRFGRLQNL